jgi:hypothetical protein
VVCLCKYGFVESGIGPDRPILAKDGGGGGIGELVDVVASSLMALGLLCNGKIVLLERNICST